MPKFNQTKTDKVIEKQQKTNTGIYVTAGDIDHSDYDTKEWSELQEDYTHMRDGNALITTTIDILKYPILMSEYRIESKNKEVEDYMYWVYNNLYKGFEYFKRHKLLALDFGLSMHEMVVKRGDKYNGKLTNRPVSFNPIQNETINQFYYDEQTRFAGIKHEKRIPNKASEYIDIYIDELEYYTYNEEYNDIRGRAILRPIRKLWESENDIITGATNTIIRGAGIPVIYTIGESNDTDRNTIEKIGRTICNMRNGYVAADKNRMEIDLIEPKGQQNIMPLLEWLDKHMFFNTMTQFMTSGIGGNGSRAATSEHKSSYELAANYVLQSLETNFQDLTDRIMKMSYLAKVPQDEYPEFHFNAINQVDLSKVAQNIKALMDSAAITKQREDEEYIRDMFGMPKLLATTDISNPQEKPVSMFEKKENESVKTLDTKSKRKLSEEKLEFERKVFSLESANEHYETIEVKIEKLLSSKYNELYKDILYQLNKDRYRSIIIRRALIEETVDEIMKLYGRGYKRGEKDVIDEIKKIGGQVRANKLQLEKKAIDKKRSIIDKLIKKLFMNTKTTIENKMESVTDKFLDIKGGLDNYVAGFETGFKTDKNNIKKNIEASYIDGRGETLMDLGDEVETFFYSARLDNSLCDECAPFDGDIFTKEEFSDEGLSFVHPVNPFCLGHVNCRCVVIPYSYGRK